MQTKSWVSDLLFDCIYSRYLFALVLEGLFKVQYDVRCAKCCKKPPIHQSRWIFVWHLEDRPGDTALF